MANPHWPLFGLRVRTPRLELRYPDDDLVYEIAMLAGRGVHPPDEMPFSVPWTDAPLDELHRNTCQFLWRQRAEWRADRWSLNLAVLVDGTPVGLQDVAAADFATRRVVGTGSWLGLAHQGHGIGTEMRSAVLHLAFAGLDADAAETCAWHDNRRSIGVTVRNGYSLVGEMLPLRRRLRTPMYEYRLWRSGWETRRRDDITIEGLERCRPMFGLDPVATE